MISCTRGRLFSICRGRNARPTSLRSRVCRGGSALSMWWMSTGLLCSSASRNQAGALAGSFDSRGSENASKDVA